jgi:hypothetical protein
MLLKTNGRTRNCYDYPTMSMIISWLFEILHKAIYYFQSDSLWKSLKSALNSHRTHDVYDRKGVNLKTRKTGSLFSTAYRQRIEESSVGFYAEPTISVVKKDLVANRQSSAISYVIENNPRSKLASRNKRLRTHDVHGIKWVKGESQFLAASYVIENNPRSKLAPSDNGFRTHDVFEAKWLSVRWPLFESSSASMIASLHVASTLGGRVPGSQLLAQTRIWVCRSSGRPHGTMRIKRGGRSNLTTTTPAGNQHPESED